MLWSEVISDPSLQNLPYKIELNEFGKIVMSPASNHHAILQARLVRLLYSYFLDGEIATECSVATSLGVKVADVVWMSQDFSQEYTDETPYPEAPELCIEILSPSNSEMEMKQKIELYLEQGAHEVWIVSDDGEIAMHGPDGKRDTSCFKNINDIPRISMPEKKAKTPRERNGKGG